MKFHKSLFFKSLAVVLSLCMLVVTIKVVHANTGGVVSYGAKGIKVGIPGLQLTSEETAPTDAGLADGRLYYDTTSGLLIRTGGAWAAVTTGTAGTADSVYNAGAWTVTADANDIIYNVSGDYTVLYKNNTAGTMASALEIDAGNASAACVITDAILLSSSGAGATIGTGLDASDGGITNAIDCGANTITGTTTVIDFTDFDVSADGVVTLTCDSATSMIVLTPSAAAKGIDASNATITTALDVGANDIVGTTGLINYTSFDVDASGNVTCNNLTVNGTWSADALAAATTTGDLSLDGHTSGGIVLGATSTGDITMTRDTVFTGDITINGDDINSDADLVITPAGGDVDISVADLWIDSGKKLSLNGTTETNYLTLSTNVQVVASADILLDPAGGDIDCDAADVQLDAGKKLSLNGSTETDTVYSSTDLQIAAAADVVITPTGGQVDFNAADVAVDSGKKVGLNGIAALTADFLYLSTNVTLNATADIELVCGGGQLDVSGGDVCVDSGKKIALAGVAGVANDFLYLSTDVVLDATADITLQAGGGQVDVSASDLCVDAAKKIGLAGVAGLANDFISYDSTDVIIDAAADIKLNGSVSVDVEAAFSVGTTSTFTGSATFNGAQIVGDGATEIVGCKHDVVTDIDNETLTIAESGTVFDNAGDGDGTIFTLPEGSTAIGCWYTFVVVAAQNLNINPADATDRFISPITDAAGDSIQSSTAGDSVTVLCIGANSWVITSAYPASTDWADAN